MVGHGVMMIGAVAACRHTSEGGGVEVGVMRMMVVLMLIVRLWYCEIIHFVFWLK